ncbi:hypothetical protein NEOLEDRAFT_1150272 [Neolentinus lepideus HHB14362 ss-1]|uniref:MULE transposase domain-containing protein n=1 Tax=Neolentinus lepideus HHB14362 ss-1 TaxID=1314782 RepID=A0A165Q6B3_9AGAM|nr:hypothetical protein NEOLEDRAFT_1150272 [Neolentinus lepideus HHB14362 ss-1]
MNHNLAHPHYTNISVPESIQKFVWEHRRQTPGQIWDQILTDNDGKSPEFTQWQIYALWQQINEDMWRLDDGQVTSAWKVLEAANGEEAEIIDVTWEKGITVMAFALKELVAIFGAETAELAMDSTWKTNAVAYELYAIVSEANCQALPMGFVLTAMTDGSATKGAKERMLTETLQWFKKHCSNVKFTLSDKDWSKIQAFHKVFPDMKHQICYWHAIKYIGERLTENKPPAAYDPWKAHTMFSFIDLTWAPGVTRGDIEEYLDGQDVEEDGNEQGGVQELLKTLREVSHNMYS